MAYNQQYMTVIWNELLRHRLDIHSPYRQNCHNG
jgi:hypothetical protein